MTGTAFRVYEDQYPANCRRSAILTGMTFKGLKKRVIYGEE